MGIAFVCFRGRDGYGTLLFFGGVGEPSRLYVCACVCNRGYVSVCVWEHVGQQNQAVYRRSKSPASQPAGKAAKGSGPAKCGEMSWQTGLRNARVWHIRRRPTVRLYVSTAFETGGATVGRGERPVADAQVQYIHESSKQLTGEAYHACRLHLLHAPVV